MITQYGTTTYNVKEEQGPMRQHGGRHEVSHAYRLRDRLLGITPGGEAQRDVWPYRPVVGRALPEGHDRWRASAAAAADGNDRKGARRKSRGGQGPDQCQRGPRGLRNPGGRYPR